MQASKGSDAQKAFILKQGDEGAPVAGNCRKAGISQAPSCNCKTRYDGLLPTEMRRLKLLEDAAAKAVRFGGNATLREERQVATGRTIRALTVVDMFSRFSPIVGPRFSRRAADVVAMLEATCSGVGDLRGPGVGVRLPRPGSVDLCEQGHAGRLGWAGRRFRAKCLTAPWFLTLADARGELKAWRQCCSEERPHGAIGDKVPTALPTRGGTASPSP